MDQGYVQVVWTCATGLRQLASNQDEIDLLNQVLNADALKEEAEEKALAKAAKDDIAHDETQV